MTFSMFIFFYMPYTEHQYLTLIPDHEVWIKNGVRQFFNSPNYPSHTGGIGSMEWVLCVSIN